MPRAAGDAERARPFGVDVHDPDVRSPPQVAAGRPVRRERDPPAVRGPRRLLDGVCARGDAAGRARDRVYEVSITDPVYAAIISANLEIKKGIY